MKQTPVLPVEIVAILGNRAKLAAIATQALQEKDMFQILREGFKKKFGKSMVFCQTRGGVSEGGEKTKLLFLTKVFFREYLKPF